MKLDKDVIKIIEIVYKDNSIKLDSNIIDESMESFGLSSQLSQVILNILNNAKDVLIENNIDIKIVNIKMAKNNNSNIIEISDNGGGIPSDIIEKVFDPYFTTKHQSQGTGIGLYMSKEIVQNRFNGNLDVKNNDIGAVFTITIPLS